MAARSFSRDTLPDRLRAAKDDAVRGYLSLEPSHTRYASYAAASDPKHNVLGVGIGHRLNNGVSTEVHAVRFYVAHKIPRHLLSSSMLLPREVRGVRTDVIETGRFFALPAVGSVMKEVRAYLRPARPGCSIGFHFVHSRSQDDGIFMAGTFGAVAQDAKGRRGILSNNHVLADENRLKVKDPIFQQGLLDGGDPKKKRAIIGELTSFHPLALHAHNTVDCAFAEAEEVAPEVLAPVGRLRSGDPVEALHGAEVEKVGRTTGYTRGNIHDVTADVKIQYDIGTLMFKDQMVIVGTPAFSQAGDSGALIVNRKMKRPVGLLFGGSSTHTLANHIADVTHVLGLRIETKQGPAA